MLLSSNVFSKNYVNPTSVYFQAILSQRLNTEHFQQFPMMKRLLATVNSD